MKVVDVKTSDVFGKLSEGIEVYALNHTNDDLINLIFESVASILELINTDHYVYFVVESEEMTDGN